MTQYSYKEFEYFIKRCLKISNDVADNDNFISVYNLAKYLNANIKIRPLLVEGMLATELNMNAINGKNKWVIFIDSETYGNLTVDNLISESINSPLPERMRNTIAHELVHTLAFIESDGVIKLSKSNKSKISCEKFVGTIERETEKLSPLLLISDLFLDNFFSSRLSNIDIHDLLTLRHSVSVSRYVLINRLSLLRKYDKKDICYRPPLRNLAMGIGEWKGKNNAVFKKWPIFFNFDGNIIPDFLSANNKDIIPVNYIFNDTSFYLLGGENESTSTNISFGTMTTHGVQKLKVKCMIEKVPRTSGKEFFYIIHKISL